MRQGSLISVRWLWLVYRSPLHTYSFVKELKNNFAKKITVLIPNIRFRYAGTQEVVFGSFTAVTPLQELQSTPIRLLR